MQPPGDAPTPIAPPKPPLAPPEHVLPRPGRAARWLVIAAAVTLFALDFVTTALSPALAARSPLLLVALEAPIRNMLLASRVPLAPFLLVVTLRRLLGATVFYFLGRWYGDAAVLWLERRAGAQGAKVRRIERLVRGAVYPMVFASPTALVCIVAGAMGVRPEVFVAVAATGSLCVGALTHLAGDALAEPIADVVRTFQRHALGATLTATAIAALAAARHAWAGRRAPPEAARRSQPPPG